MVLSAEQVAEVMKEVILSENPNFRYQTNKQYCPDEIAAKLADIHGNKSVDIITKRFCDEWCLTSPAWVYNSIYWYEEIEFILVLRML